MISNPYQFFGRENDLYFRKMTYHDDYDPTYSGFMKSQTNLKLSGIFQDLEGKEYSVILDNSGIVHSDLPRYNSDQEGWAVFTDADHPMNMQKFQLRKEAEAKFMEIASYVYGLPLTLSKEITTHDFNDSATFYQDLIIHKKEVKVHFSIVKES